MKKIDISKKIFATLGVICLCSVPVYAQAENHLNDSSSKVVQDVSSEVVVDSDIEATAKLKATRVESGWKKVSSSVYNYLDESGNKLVGKHNIDGKTYIFDSNGRLYIGWHEVSAKKITYSDIDNGTYVDSFAKIDGNTYYFDANGYRVHGTYEVDGKRYYFGNYSGKLFHDGWHRDYSKSGEYYWYLDPTTGVIAQNEWVVVNGVTYHTDSNGYKQVGYQTINGNKYYFGRYSGKLFADGWHADPWNGKMVYLDPNNKGAMYVNCEKSINGKNFKFDEYGYCTSGAWVKGADGNTYYKQFGKLAKGYQTIDGKKYYFGRHSGKLFHDGWHTDPWNGKEIFLSPKDGSIPSNAWVTFKGNTYHTDSNGYKLVGYQTFNGNKYYLGRHSGKLFCEGWHTDPWNGKAVYLDPNNNGAMPVNCEKSINGKNFKFDKDGYCTSGVWVTEGGNTYYKQFGKVFKGYQTIDGKKYYFGRHSGKLFKDGWHVDPWNGKKIYLSPKDGSIPLNEWVEHNGATYHTDKNGYRQLGIQNIDGKKYYFGISSGKLYRDGWHKDPNAKGNANWYLDRQTGVMAQGWKDIDGATYYFGNDCYAYHGIKQIGSNKYYFDNKTSKLQRGWSCVGENKWVYSDNNGVMYLGKHVINTTQKGSEDIVYNKEYDFGTNGIATVGWETKNSNKMYFSPDCGYLKDGMHKVGSDTYLFDANGYMKKGLQNYKSKTYYFGKNSGKLYCDGWHQNPYDRNYYWYLDPNNNGALFKGKHNIKGVTYNFGTNGQIHKNALHSYNRHLEGLTSPTNYIVMVDRTKVRVYVFKRANGGWNLIKDLPCSIGAPNTPTPTGVTHLGFRDYYFGHGYTCWYFREFRSGGYGFHSILYRQNSKSSVLDGRMGRWISHGCVRMQIDDARYIYNLPGGTTVKVY